MRHFTKVQMPIALTQGFESAKGQLWACTLLASTPAHRVDSNVCQITCSSTQVERFTRMQVPTALALSEPRGSCGRARLPTGWTPVSARSPGAARDVEHFTPRCRGRQLISRTIK